VGHVPQEYVSLLSWLIDRRRIAIFYLLKWLYINFLKNQVIYL
jgi:hypothetical protein